MKIKVGLEILEKERFKRLKGKKIGLLANHASVNLSFINSSDLFLTAARKGIFRITALFGPQQGLFEIQQANMIEWEGNSIKNRWGVPIYSLYGETRKPTPEMLSDIECFVVDLQDVGARGYTFISTLYYVMEACMDRDIEVLVLDRPNPIGCSAEGPITDDRFKSFVGIHRIPIRHGLTFGETAMLFKNEIFRKCRVTVARMSGYKRNMLWPDTERAWIPTTPNLPFFDSLLVYPGMELFEGTNISEGRGTTRPFEQFGAPFIDPHMLSDELNSLKISGVRFRPISFSPTFDKFQGDNCYGSFIHVTDRKKFRPVATALKILSMIKSRYPDKFSFKSPPYEYEYKKLPFDILAGTPCLREAIEQDRGIPEIEKSWLKGIEEYKKRIAKVLLYR